MSSEGPNVSNFVIETPLSDLQKFEQGTIWRDIKRFFGTTLDSARDELEFAGKGTSVTPDEMPYTIGFHQGKAAHARLSMDVVRLLITAKEGEIEDAKRKRESSGD